MIVMAFPFVDLAIQLYVYPPSVVLEAILSLFWQKERTDPTSSSSSSRSSWQSNPDVDTGAHPGDGSLLHSSLLNLIE